MVSSSQREATGSRRSLVGVERDLLKLRPENTTLRFGLAATDDGDSTMTAAFPARDSDWLRTTS
jgi:hypothetical protein